MRTKTPPEGMSDIRVRHCCSSLNAAVNSPAAPFSPPNSRATGWRLAATRARGGQQQPNPPPTLAAVLGGRRCPPPLPRAIIHHIFLKTNHMETLTPQTSTPSPFWGTRCETCAARTGAGRRHSPPRFPLCGAALNESIHSPRRHAAGQSAHFRTTSSLAKTLWSFITALNHACVQWDCAGQAVE